MNALIVTLTLDPDLSTLLTSWRTRYFPPDRNYLDAHVTLFHAVPGEDFARVNTDLAAVAASTPTFGVRVPGAFSLGRGVALDVIAPEIAFTRARLRERWLDRLSPQDQPANKRAHVTVQNKVDPARARDTLEEIRATWDARTHGRATGLSLFEYRGGPWEPLAHYKFS